MKTTININGSDVEITLTKEQIEKIKKTPQKITDRVKTFEDAMDIKGYKSADIIPFPKPKTKHQEALNAYAKLFVINEALNEDYEPNWNDSNEYKYYPWFDMRSGFGFSCSDYAGWSTDSSVGSRLCFKSRELAEYAGKQFEDIYKAAFVK